jgi:hypothetical protein
VVMTGHELTAMTHIQIRSTIAANICGEAFENIRNDRDFAATRS